MATVSESTAPSRAGELICCNASSSLRTSSDPAPVMKESSTCRPSKGRLVRGVVRAEGSSTCRPTQASTSALNSGPGCAPRACPAPILRRRRDSRLATSMLSAGMACMVKGCGDGNLKKPAGPVACASGPGSVEAPNAARRAL
eukprot:scaffold62938_cov46-Phaeocystis_antarctica.AAC.1